MTDAVPLLDVRNLCVRYRMPVPLGEWLLGRRRFIDAVIDASFTLREGETLAIVGESGSGKSSLGLALAGLEPIYRGEVRLQGKNPFIVTPGGDLQFHRQVAIVFQDAISSLSPRRTVRQLLGEPYAIHGIHDRDIDAEVTNLLGLVGLTPAIAGRYPHELSGGQARRVGVARAVALSPRLIVADEPTAGLDVSVQAEVLNLMRHLQDRLGISYILVTHNISLIQHVADQVAVMYMGRIVEAGATEAVFGRPSHPYARALIAAQPIPDPDLRRTGAPILGETPSLLRRPTGCEFRTRCPNAFDRCTVEAPPITTRPGGQLSRCWLAMEGSPQA